MTRKYGQNKAEQMAQNIDKILASVERLPLSTAAIIKTTGIGRETVTLRISELHGERRVHICDWERPYGRWNPVWKAGRGIDAPRPGGTQPRRPRKEVKFEMPDAYIDLMCRVGQTEEAI